MNGKSNTVRFLMILGFLALIGSEYGLAISLFIIAWFIAMYG